MSMFWHLYTRAVRMSHRLIVGVRGEEERSAKMH